MTKSYLKLAVFSALLCSLFLATPKAMAEVTSCPVLGDALVEHSCFHARFGPFTTALATSGREVTPETPNIDAVHTEFRVGLAGSRSSVTYTPVRSGIWAMFRGTDVPVRLFRLKEDQDPAEEEISPAFDVDGETGCDALSLASAFELQESVRYRIEFGPTTADHVIVVLEYLDDFLIENGRDDDGDGYGRADDVVVTACAPPAGYAQNALDCDDDDPNVHPGAPETCDGSDQNCNGLADDEGLTCRVGEGVCQAVGVIFCPSEGSVAECDASSSRPTPEVCNGLDDDCDGEIDDQVDDLDLCSEWDAPTCVRQETSAFCGCLLDLDCGSRESGFICDTEARRCVPGCSTSPGHNGCPSGEKCDESVHPSICVDEVTVPIDDDDDDDEDDDPGREFQPVEPSCGCHIIGAGPSTRGVSLLGALALFFLAFRRRARSRLVGVAKRAVLMPFKRPGISILKMLLMVTGLSGCGGRAVETENSDSPPSPKDNPADCVPVLDSAVVSHSCSHITNGPFVVVAPASTSREAPDVSRVHTPFDVDVIETPSELQYNPTRDGEHVLFLGDSDVELSIYRGEVALAPRRFPVEGCALVADGILVDFEAGESYRFLVPSKAGAPFLLFVEHLGTFGDDAWETSCE